MRYGFAYGGLCAAAIAFAVASSSGSLVRADAPADAVVARVGKHTITAGELTRRLLAIPPFQLKTLGRTEDEIKRTFLERVLVRDLLLAQAAEEQKIPQEEAVEERVRATLRAAMVQEVRAETQADAITDEDVARYYKENEDKFRAPERVAIWRILLATREDALKLVQDVSKGDQASVTRRWTDLARERSLDKATSMRGGNLGYVGPDGKTTDGAITVDPAVLARVKALKDGELATEPVKEGEGWSVVWRRQTMKAVDRPLAQEAPGIRQAIGRQRVEERVKAILEKARAEHVRDLKLELADEVTVTSQGDLQPLRRPGVLPARRSAPGLPQPGHDHR